jgi:hypothetical protein
MSRDQYLIVRIDHVIVPSVVAYLGHGETPYDLNVRYTTFRESATVYSNKRDAIRQAQVSARFLNRYQFKVVGVWSHACVWNSTEVQS